MDSREMRRVRLVLDAQQREFQTEHSPGIEMRSPHSSSIVPKTIEHGGEIVVYAAASSQTEHDGATDFHTTMPETILLTGLALIYALIGDAHSALIFCLASLISLYQLNRRTT